MVKDDLSTMENQNQDLWFFNKEVSSLRISYNDRFLSLKVWISVLGYYVRRAESGVFKQLSEFLEGLALFKTLMSHWCRTTNRSPNQETLNLKVTKTRERLVLGKTQAFISINNMLKWKSACGVYLHAPNHL